ncbi:putative site-specific recombinase [Oscillibacter valericigenes Sjm18-20]|nr:putative site-specific recombinase [Oscillibacter valericigenes Sjm18-20]
MRNARKSRKGVRTMNSTLSYTKNGDYLIPDLKLSEQRETSLGKYGRMRRGFLKEHRPILWNSLILSEKLYPHLLETEQTAQSRLEQMMPELAKAAGVTEALKASDPMKWVGLMNNCKAQAEEAILKELIFS